MKFFLQTVKIKTRTLVKDALRETDRNKKKGRKKKKKKKEKKNK